MREEMGLTKLAFALVVLFCGLCTTGFFYLSTALANVDKEARIDRTSLRSKIEYNQQEIIARLVRIETLLDQAKKGSHGSAKTN